MLAHLGYIVSTIVVLAVAAAGFAMGKRFGVRRFVRVVMADSELGIRLMQQIAAKHHLTIKIEEYDNGA